MNRGDIWHVDLGGRIGKRPVVVLTRQNRKIILALELETGFGEI